MDSHFGGAVIGLLCQWYSVFRSNGGVSVSGLAQRIWRRDSYTALPDREGDGDGDGSSDENGHGHGRVHNEEFRPPRSGDIATWMWAPGLVVAVAASMLSMKLTFGISLLKTLLALGLAFLLSLVAIQATGATGKIVNGP